MNIDLGVNVEVLRRGEKTRLLAAVAFELGLIIFLQVAIIAEERNSPDAVEVLVIIYQHPYVAVAPCEHHRLARADPFAKDGERLGERDSRADIVVCQVSQALDTSSELLAYLRADNT